MFCHFFFVCSVSLFYCLGDIFFLDCYVLMRFLCVVTLILAEYHRCSNILRTTASKWTSVSAIVKRDTSHFSSQTVTEKWNRLDGIKAFNNRIYYVLTATADIFSLILRPPPPPPPLTSASLAFCKSFSYLAVSSVFRWETWIRIILNGDNEVEQIQLRLIWKIK